MVTRKQISLEMCDGPCPFVSKICLTISKEKGNSYCGQTRIREILEEWVCDRCGRTLGVGDVRHTICIPPSEELQKRIAKACVQLVHVCDSCMLNGEELFETYGLSP